MTMSEDLTLLVSDAKPSASSESLATTPACCSIIVAANMACSRCSKASLAGKVTG